MVWFVQTWSKQANKDEFSSTKYSLISLLHFLPSITFHQIKCQVLFRWFLFVLLFQNLSVNVLMKHSPLENQQITNFSLHSEMSAPNKFNIQHQFITRVWRISICIFQQVPYSDREVSNPELAQQLEQLLSCVLLENEVCSLFTSLALKRDQILWHHYLH